MRVLRSVPCSSPGLCRPGNGGDDAALAARLSALARDLQRLSSPPEVLDRIVSEVVEMVSGADDATIAIAGRRRCARSAAASSERATLRRIATRPEA